MDTLLNVAWVALAATEPVASSVTVWDTILKILMVIVGLAMIVVVMLQKSKGEGLGAIGGGAQLFFDKTKGFEKSLQRLTGILAAVFLVLTLLIAIRAA